MTVLWVYDNKYIRYEYIIYDNVNMKTINSYELQYRELKRKRSFEQLQNWGKFVWFCLQVASEHFYFWLSALKFFCEAESLLSAECDTQLGLSKQVSDASAKYHKGITTLKVRLICIPHYDSVNSSSAYVPPSPPPSILVGHLVKFKS